MTKVDTVLAVKPLGRRSLPGRQSSREMGQGRVLLFMIRFGALAFTAERPGLVEQLPGGGAARLFWLVRISVLLRKQIAAQ